MEKRLIVKQVVSTVIMNGERATDDNQCAYYDRSLQTGCAIGMFLNRSHPLYHYIIDPEKNNTILKVMEYLRIQPGLKDLKLDDLLYPIHRGHSEVWWRYMQIFHDDVYSWEKDKDDSIIGLSDLGRARADFLSEDNVKDEDMEERYYGLQAAPEGGEPWGT